MNRTSLTAAFLAAGLVGALSACGSSSDDSTGGSNDSLTSVSFRTDFLPSGRYAGFFYAKEKGYYKDEGLDVTINTGKGSAITAQDVAAGHTDIGMVDGSVMAISVGKGVPIKGVGSFAGKNQFGMFVDKKLGVSSIADLKGKSVIIKPGTTQAVMIPAVMASVGLKSSDYKSINIDPSAAQGAYNSGKGDALADDIAEATPAIKRDSTTLPWADTGLVLPGYTFIASTDYIDEHADDIAKFLKATYRGMNEAFADPEAAVAVVAKANPTLPKQSLLAQFTAEKDYLCTDAMTKAGEVVGYPDKSDWEAALKNLKEYADVPANVTVDDVVTDEFFSGKYNVSAETCGG